MPPTEETRIDKLVNEHLALVSSIAQKVAKQVSTTLDYDELLACGREGLVQAAHRYDPERGVAFSTFAYYRIRGAIFDGVRKLGPVVPGNRRLNFEERADQYIEQQSGELKPQTAVAAAERLGNMVADLATAYVLSCADMSEEPDHSAVDPGEAAETREELALVHRNLDRLPDNEQQLIRMMYFDDLTMQQAAAKLGITKGWASRLHARALSRLRRGVEAPPQRPPAIKV